MKKILIFVLLINFCFLTACASSNLESEKIPALIDISLYADDGSQITPEDGWYFVPAHTKIEVRFDGDVDEIFFYLTPSGTETSGLREKIGYVSAYDLDSTGEIGFGHDSGLAEFVWNTPRNGFLGYLGIELINGTVARIEPSVLNITNRD
jgi:hypothetical protein